MSGIPNRKRLVGLFAQLAVAVICIANYTDTQHGTAVVYFRNPSVMFVGADSKVVDSGRKPLPNTCKIGHEKQTYFVFTGPTSRGRQSNVSMAAAKAIDHDGDLSETGDEFVKLISPDFERWMPEVERTLLEDFHKTGDPFNRDRFIFAEILFWKMEKGSPYYALRTFRAVRGNGNPVIQVTPEDCLPTNCLNSTVINALGKQKAFKEFSSRREPITDAPPQIIEKLLRKEMTIEPDTVGGNVNLMKLDASGATWLINTECK
jgi:hypothetical protein